MQGSKADRYISEGWGWLVAGEDEDRSQIKGQDVDRLCLPRTTVHRLALILLPQAPIQDRGAAGENAVIRACGVDRQCDRGFR